MNILQSIQNDIQGAQVLKDWWGAGGHPVAQSQADHRSLSCVRGNDGEPCPHNRGATWLEEHSKEPIAQAIKEQLEVKNKLKMETVFDGALHFCDVCGCKIALAIWTPIEHIKAHTDLTTLSRYTPYCWKRIELENL